MSASQYLVGIDGGSQSTKVVIYDTHGKVAAAGRRPLRPPSTPSPGVVEHPDDDLWDSLAGACRDALAAFPGEPGDLAGVGLCTIRFCRALVRADGRLAAPVMSWMDARVSRPYVHEDPAVAVVTTSSGYLTRRLTGRFTDTAANYQGEWPIDTGTWAWPGTPESYPPGGLRPDMLSRLVLPGEVLGTVTAEASAATGLPAGLPVVATANDKAVEALGCGLVDDEAALISLGTYIAAMVTGSGNPAGAVHFWPNFACQPHRYLYESHGIRRGMWTVSWLRDLLGEELAARARTDDESVEDLMNRAAAAVPAGSDGLMTVLDWLAPVSEPHRKGIMIGFDQRHGWPHMYRSILEGIALTMADRLRAMCTELGRPLTRVVVSGGGSGSDTMMQIVADILGIPASRPGVASAASLGSAICAAVGTGLHPGFPAAAGAMIHPGTAFTPDPCRTGIYERLADVYRSIPGHTDAVLTRSYALFR